MLNRYLYILLAALLCSPAASAEKRSAQLSDIAIHPLRTAPATVVSNNQATLSSQLLATIESIKVGVSQEVRKGALLLELDCTDYDLALQMAQEELNVAKARLELAARQKKRSDQLLGKQLTSQESADNTEVTLIAQSGQLELASLGLRKAQINIGRCQVLAPFDGIVTERIISEGQLAAVGSPLLSLTDTTRMELSAQVRPSDIPQLQITPTLAFESDVTVPVKLLRLGGVVNSQTRTQEIRLAFVENADVPGKAGILTWRDPRNFLPSNWVVKRKTGFGVFIEADGIAKFHLLPDAIPGRPALTDLPETTLIITKGLGQLEPGQKLSSP